MKLRIVCLLVGFSSLVLSLAAQTMGSSPASAQVPPLIQFSNVASDEGGNTLSGVVNITFSLYSSQQGGEALWTETQNNVPLDPTGHYSVQLGITKPTGVPTTLFTTGEAHWLGVRIAEQAEQPRVLLVSVPYALKAGDAATVGGLPPSAFVLAAPANGAAATYTAELGTEQSVSPATATDVTTSGGTANYLPVFNGTSTIKDSVVYQSGAKVGINTTTPGATLDVKGTANVEGLLTLPATGAATSSGGRFSQGQEFVASSYNSGTAAAVNQTFELRAEPVANDSASPSGTLSLLFGSGTAAPAETGLKIASTGQLTFATGQTFPGVGTLTGITTATGSGLTGGGTSGTLSLGLLKTCTTNQVLEWNGTKWACATVSGSGSGTVTSVATGLGLLGGPITTSGTLSINTAVVPQLAAANSFTNNQTISGSASAFGLTVSQPNQLGILVQGPESGAGAGLDFAATGSGGLQWEILDTGSGSSEGANKLNIRNVTGALDVMTLAANGQVGIGTTVGEFDGVQLEVDAQLTSAGTLDAVQVVGYTGASGSGDWGTGGLDAFGGNGDPTLSGSQGGIAVYAQGGTGANFDGDGGYFIGGDHSSSGEGIFALAGSGDAGYFEGNVEVTGTLNGSAPEVKIDHPLDPANKYLYHASVESSERINIYTGNVTTDGEGGAQVQLPGWFETVNTDFRYQLTVIGQFAQAIVAHEIENNRFGIRTSVPNVKVSWQVTGVRQDAYAKAHPLVVEQEKEARLRGFYIHPELYGAPPEKQIEWARHPQMMKRVQEMRAKQQAPLRAAVQPATAQPK